MKKIGLFLNNWGPSDIAFDAIYNAERAPREIDVLGFYLSPSRPCLAPRFGIVESYVSYAYPGTLVATSLATADRVVKASSSHDRYFYIWDLEWLHNVVPFSALYEILTKLKLVARTDEIAKKIEDTWDVEVKVAKNFRELWSILQGLNNE